MVHVTMRFLPNARMHGHGNGHPMDTGASVQDKRVFAFDRITMTERVHIALQLLSRVCEWHQHAYILNELAHYMTTSFNDKCIPQREMSIHLTLSPAKEEAGSFTL